jgi:hypothetical protein
MGSIEQRRLQKDYSYITLAGIMMMIATINPVTLAPSLIILSFLAFMEYD